MDTYVPVHILYNVKYRYHVSQLLFHKMSIFNDQSCKLPTVHRKSEQFIQLTASSFCSLDSYTRLHTTTIFMKNLQLIVNHMTKCTSILFVKIQTFPIHKQTHPVTKSFQQHSDHPLNILLILKWEGRSEHTFSVSSRDTSSTHPV